MICLLRSVQVLGVHQSYDQPGFILAFRHLLGVNSDRHTIGELLLLRVLRNSDSSQNANNEPAHLYRAWGHFLRAKAVLPFRSFSRNQLSYIINAITSRLYSLMRPISWVMVCV